MTRRQVQIRQDQEESLRAREVLLREMEVLAQETARETGAYFTLVNLIDILDYFSCLDVGINNSFLCVINLVILKHLTARTEREKEGRRKEIDRQTTERRLAEHRTAREALDQEEGER